VALLLRRGGEERVTSYRGARVAGVLKYNQRSAAGEKGNPVTAASKQRSA
jgi:hypothetical protein